MMRRYMERCPGSWTWAILSLVACSSLVQAQTPTISITSTPTSVSLPALNLSSPAVLLDVPASVPYLTFNIASLGSNTSILPSVIVSTASSPSFALGRTSLDASSGGPWDSGNAVNRAGDTWKLQWDLGFANWTGQENQQVQCLLGLGVSDNGTIAGPGRENGNVIVQVGFSSTNPLQSLSPTSIFLGDTTADSVLLFSPLLLSDPRPQPTYPNYTLPPAQLPLAAYPGPSAQTNLTSLSSNLALIIVPTSSSPTNDGLDNSITAVHAANESTGSIAATGNMLVNGVTQWVAIDGQEGYRTMWVVGSLLAQTNYTAWVLDDQGGMSAPIWFETKESSFPCQLALPNDICPALGYSVPLPANTSTTTLLGSETQVPFPLHSYPDQINDMITSSLEAFSISLTTIACGRDLYSHVATCADCYASYRDWLCRVTLPQCASSVTPATNVDIAPQTTNRNQSTTRADGVQSPYDYTELLPCLSNCNRADRDCPVFLQFRCPDRQNTASETYAFIGDDSDDADGDPMYGPPPIDRWGWRWCNG